MSTFRFDGRVALVTGAGGGLGRSHALELASRGAKVVVNDVGGALDGTGESRAAADQVVAEITGAGGIAVADHNTVATPEGAAAMVGTTIANFGRIDILVNNAGILRDTSFRNMSWDKVEPVLAVHVGGAFNVTGAAWSHFLSQGYGRIVTTSSAAGIFGNFGQANYGAAKAALVGLTRVLAVEGRKYGIKANVVVPVAKSRMTEGLPGTKDFDRLGPEHVSPLVAWLAHEDVTVTGQLYSCGGGHIAKIFTGVTTGWTSGGVVTAEEIAANIQEIESDENYFVPRNAGDEVAATLRALRDLV